MDKRRSIALFSAAMGVVSTLLCCGGRVGGVRAGPATFPGKSLAETLVMLPLVLPPVATGLSFLASVSA